MLIEHGVGRGNPGRRHAEERAGIQGWTGKASSEQAKGRWEARGEAEQEQPRRGVDRVKHHRIRWQHLLEENDDSAECHLELPREGSTLGPWDCVLLVHWSS